MEFGYYDDGVQYCGIVAQKGLLFLFLLGLWANGFIGKILWPKAFMKVVYWQSVIRENVIMMMTAEDRVAWNQTVSQLNEALNMSMEYSTKGTNRR